MPYFSRAPWPAVMADPAALTAARAQRQTLQDQLEAAAATGGAPRRMTPTHLRTAERRWRVHYDRVRAAELERLQRQRRYQLDAAPTAEARRALCRHLLPLDAAASPSLSART